VTTTGAPRAGTGRKLAINRLRQRQPLDEAAVDRFLARHEVPVVEGAKVTFLWRGEADAVSVRHRVVGMPEPLPLRKVRDADLWYAVVEVPENSRIEYQFEIVRGEERIQHVNDPLNPKVAHSPIGSSSVLAGSGYHVPDWAQHDPEARPGEVFDLAVRSQALRRTSQVSVYLPARFRRTVRYPLLVVHDGEDYLRYAAMKTVLDNLIHRLDMAETVVAFIRPGNRLVEYANSAAHARFVRSELVPTLEAELPLAATSSARCLMGSSFGAIASLSTAVRHPGVFGSLLMQSGSFLFTDIGSDHGGGPAFDPVVKFVNRYRARPARVTERIFLTCGVYEPMSVRNRSMVSTFQQAGVELKYVEARDGHNWENWRDRLRDGLSWIFPGPRKYVYE
jgi:enterochelin esterase family protein